MSSERSAMILKLPAELEADMARARRLEWWSLFWLATIIVLMAVVMGSSQAMKTAWIEDLLSLLAPTVFLISTRVEERSPNRKFPFGFLRADAIASLVAAVALTALGGVLLVDAAISLISLDHPTIGSFTLFGQQIWLGWAMIAVLIYSAIPPVILGHKKIRIAEKLADRVLYGDADTNKADWMTAAAAILGISLIGLGFWWGDAAAAALISASVIKDGVRNLMNTVAELGDGAPRKLDSRGLDPLVGRLHELAREIDPDCTLRVRSVGRYITGHLETTKNVTTAADLAERLEAVDWRVVYVGVLRARDGIEAA